MPGSNREPGGIKEVLEHKVEQIRAELKALARNDLLTRTAGAQMQYGKRIGDHTTDAVAHRSTVGAADNLERLLEDVLAALSQIEDGNYGFCQDCHKPIPVSRLTALPWARRCLECQAKSERRR
jgi:DnaK suppressor protein